MSRRHETFDTPADQLAEGHKEQRSSFRFALGGTALLIVVVSIFGLRGGASPPPQPTTVPEATARSIIPPPTALPPTATPPDAAIAPYVARIKAYEAKGSWSEAVSEAENTLDLPDLSDGNRKIITRYAVADGLKDLYTQPFSPLDKKQQQVMIDRYLALKQRAHDASVEFDTPRQVASRAFPSSQFHLARVALEEALKDGTFNPEIDRDITRMYVSTLYGLGAWYITDNPGTALYNEGLSWLVASDQVAVKYNTGQREADALLAQRGYPNRSERPQPAATPLLAVP